VTEHQAGTDRGGSHCPLIKTFTKYHMYSDLAREP